MVENVSAHEQELDQIAGDVTPRDVKPSREVGEREAIGDGDDVCHTVSGVDDHVGGGTSQWTCADAQARDGFACVLESQKKAGNVPCA